jgi:hypothetical protein
MIQGYSVGATQGPTNSFALTPSDSTLIYDPNVVGGPAITIRSIYIGSAGNIQFTTLGGNVTVYPNLNAGTRLSGFFTKVWATNTTASNLVGEY